MKKIVALVLSLVMVLGLATTAFGATATAATTKDLGNFVMVSTDVAAAEVKAWDYTVHNAVAPKDLAVAGVKDGVIVDGEYGAVTFYTFTANGVTGNYVQVASVADADYTVYYAKDVNGTLTKTDSVFMYIAALDQNPEYAGTATLFTNFGDKCGQYDVDPVENTKYYLFQGSLYNVVPTGNANVSLMIDGKLTSVVEVATLADMVGHVAKMTYDATYKVTAVECAECGVAAKIYSNFASVPKADKAAGNFEAVNNGEYYCWTSAPAAPEAPETDKVESAETFDAGIAMYVGMSVMAAAGSAVVLKKKD